MTLRQIIVSVGLVLCLMLAGCEVPAQVWWSPDGSRAAYIMPTGEHATAMVIDSEGKPLAMLGKSSGGAAWSADSSRLYVATVGNRPPQMPAVEVSPKWLNAVEERENLELDVEQGDQVQMVSVWSEGHLAPLATLGGRVVLHMKLSPDGEWLAIMTLRDDKKKDRNELWALSLLSRRLYPISFGAAKGMAFTGPRRLAFVEPNHLVEGKPSELGSLVEVVLDEQETELKREPLAFTLMLTTSWIEAAGEDLLFTAAPITLPMASPVDEEQISYALMRYDRAQRKLMTVIKDVGEYFAPDPAGRQALVQAMPDRKDPRKSRLALVELAGGKVHDLAPAYARCSGSAEGMPLFPAWRGSDQITFASPAAVREQEQRAYVDVVQYQVTGDRTLKPIRTLSEKWQPEIKPSFRMTAAVQPEAR